MKHEIKKIAKIVDEVLTYFMVRFDAAADIRVERLPGLFRLRFEFAPVAIGDEDLQRLEKRLGGRRQPELEDYYWQLAGETEDNSEIRLVAMMCDTGTVERRGETLVVELTRRVK